MQLFRMQSFVLYDEVTFSLLLMTWTNLTYKSMCDAYFHVFYWHEDIVSVVFRAIDEELQDS